MKVQIKHRYNGNVLFECDVPEEYSGMAMRHALEEATEAKANIAYANLTRADLTDANLTRADLTYANLTDAKLTDANLTYANLTDANLTDADLTRANLTDANLTSADLTRANLTDADLTRADLTYANLTYANLTDAKNTPLVIHGLNWVVQINGFGQMKIGCQKHDVSAWRDFDDDAISAMAVGALSFWKQHKTTLLAICENYKHEAGE